MFPLKNLARCGFAVCLTGSIGLTHAAVPTAYVSGTGSDGNVSRRCLLDEPCRTFAAAVGVVPTGGEVVALDTANYGPVIITKSLTITGPNGTYAGITAPNPGNGITINAPGAIVRLRGLNIESNQPPVVGLTTLPANGIGIDIVAAASVSVENCVIAGFPYIGIAALALSNSTQSTPLQLNVIDSVFVQDGYTAALFLAPNNVAGGATVTATVHNVSFNGVGNYVGNGNEALAVGAGASLAIDSSQIVGYMFGVFVFANSGQAYMVATNNVWNNGAYNVSVGGGLGSNIADLRSNLLTGTSTTNPAIVSAWSVYGLAGSQTSDAAVFVGSTGAVSLDANTISGNSVGVNQVGGSGTASSFGNNQFVSNGTDVTGTLSSVATK